MNSVIFDLDGTLADTSGDLIAAANSCFRAMGQGDLLDPETDQLTAFHGGKAMLRLGFSRLDQAWSEADVDREWHGLIAYYTAHIDRHTVLYDGVEAMLDQLATRYRLGVCTNKPDDLAEDLLGRLGIRDRFGAMLGANALPVRKPDPTHLTETILRLGGDPARAVLIGDTENDSKAAAAAGVPCILVGFGPSGLAVRDLNPDAVLMHYRDLPEVLQDLGL